MGDGAFAIHLVDRHFFAIGIVPANRRVDDAFVVGQHAVYNRPVATRDVWSANCTASACGRRHFYRR